MEDANFVAKSVRDFKNKEHPESVTFTASTWKQACLKATRALGKVENAKWENYSIRIAKGEYLQYRMRKTLGHTVVVYCQDHLTDKTQTPNIFSFENNGVIEYVDPVWGNFGN